MSAPADAAPPTSVRGLEPLPFQRELARYLESEEAAAWEWFASSQAQAEHAEEVRLSLLKSSYRLDPGTHAELHGRARDVLALLDLDVPVTLYQSQVPGPGNAGLAYIPGECHIVFQGPVLERLTEAERSAVLAHEGAHLMLLDGWRRAYQVADRLLVAAASSPRAAPSHVESARLNRLFQEIFCDRASLHVTGDLEVAVSSLVKVTTGLESVSARSYLAQAEEILSRDRSVSQGPTHPEPYIRARALALYAERGAEADVEIELLLRGPLDFDRPDLLRQREVERFTRALLATLTEPGWMRSDAVLAHARLFFEDFAPGIGEGVSDALEALPLGSAKLRDYACFALLDFAAADPDLDDAPVAHALGIARRLGVEERFLELVREELRVGKRRLDRLAKDAEAILARAEEAHAVGGSS